MQYIYIYNLVNIILFPIHILILLFRVWFKKENFNSLRSRFGLYTQRSPDNSKLIWIHAASVGESMIALTLSKTLKTRYPDIEILITTGTISSAGILTRQAFKGIRHEFTPLDNWFVVRRFYRYWRPSLGIFIESELWPGLLTSDSRKCKLLLINARLSNKSFKKWQKFPTIFRLLVSNFSYIALQSKMDFKKYKALGLQNWPNLGNLKFASKPLEVNHLERQKLAQVFGIKQLFVAASTYAEDELVILEIIHKFRQRNLQTNIYPVIILRHPDRVRELVDNCQKLNLTYRVRVMDNNIYLPDIRDDLYIVNSFGELGLFYDLASITFIGGSFQRGGHNLLEPAHFGNVILLGPDMSNFQDITDEMVRAGAAVQIANKEELEAKILFFSSEKNNKTKQGYQNNAKIYANSKQDVLNHYLEQIEKFLPLN